MADDLKMFSEMESQFIDDCKKTGEQKNVTEDVIRSLLTLWVKFHDGHQGNTLKDANMCLESLLLCTGRIVFNPRYSKKISKDSKSDLKSKIEQCQGFLNSSKCQNVFNGIASIVDNPWQSSAFNSVVCNLKESVLSPSESAILAANNLWKTEGWAMLTCRVEYLSANLDNKLALDRFRQLVHIIVTNGRHQADLKTKTEDNALDPYTVPFEKYLEYLQVYAILVYKKKIEIKTIENWDGELLLHVIGGLHEKSKNPCSERLFSKLKDWNNDGLEAAKFLATVTTKEKLKFEDNLKLAEFYKKWTQLYESKCTDEGETEASLDTKTPFHQILESLEGHSSSSLYGISNAILMVDKTEETRSNYVELFMQALIKDMAQIEEEKATNDTENIRKLDKALSSRLLQLAIFFKDYPKMGRECLLTAFSLNPCESLFNCLFPTEEDFIISENDPPELSDIKELKFDSGICKEEEDLHLPSGLCDELSTWIFRPRYKGLFRWATKEELKALCRKLLKDKSVDVIENRELNYVNVDFEKYKDFKPQYDPDDDGFEKGYSAREYKILQRKMNPTISLVQRTKRVKMEQTEKTTKLRRNINGVSSGRAGSRKDLRGNHYMSGREIPNICLKTNPWNPSDIDERNSLLKYGHSELFSKFMHPFEPSLKEKSTVRNLNGEMCLIKLSVLSSFLSQFQNDGVSNQTCGEMPSQSQPSSASTESVHQSANQPSSSSEGGLPEELNVSDNNTLWPSMHIGDGFPTDAANEHAFRLVVQQTFAKASIAGGNIFSPPRKRPTSSVENIANISPQKKRITSKREPPNRGVKKIVNTTEKRPKGRPRKVIPCTENADAGISENYNIDKSQYQLQNGDLIQGENNLANLEESQLNMDGFAPPHDDDGGASVADPMPPAEPAIPCGGFLIKAFYTNTTLRPFTTYINKDQEFSHQSQQAPTTAATPETTKQGEKRTTDMPSNEQLQMMGTTVNEVSQAPRSYATSTEIQNRETPSLPTFSDTVISKSKNHLTLAPPIPDPEIKVSTPTIKKIISSKGGKRRIAVRSQWGESDYNSAPTTSAPTTFYPSNPTTFTSQLINNEAIGNSKNNEHFVQQCSTFISSSSNVIPSASTLSPANHQFEKDEPVFVVNDSTPRQDQMPPSIAIKSDSFIDQESKCSHNNVKINDPKGLEEPCEASVEKVPKEAELGSSINNSKCDGEEVPSKCKDNTTFEENGHLQNTADKSTVEIAVSINLADNEKGNVLESMSYKDSESVSLNMCSSPLTESKENLGNSENIPSKSAERERTLPSNSFHDVKEDSVPSPASESCSSSSSEASTKMKSKSSDTKSHTVKLGLLSKVQQLTNFFPKKPKPEKIVTPVPDCRKTSIKEQEQNTPKDSNKTINTADTPPESLRSSSGMQDTEFESVECNAKFQKEGNQALDENESKDTHNDNIVSVSAEDVQAGEFCAFQDIFNEPSNHSVELPNLKELPTEVGPTAAENKFVEDLIGYNVYNEDSGEVKQVICDMVNQVAEGRSGYLHKLLENIEGVLTKTPETIIQPEEYNMPVNNELEISTEINTDKVMEENASVIGDDKEATSNNDASFINNVKSNSPLNDSNFSQALPDLVTVEPTYDDCDNSAIQTATEIPAENLENTQDSLIDEDFQTPCSQPFDDDVKPLENEPSEGIRKETCENEKFEERSCSPEFVNANESLQDEVELEGSGEEQLTAHSQCSTSIHAEDFEHNVDEEEPTNNMLPSEESEISIEEKNIELNQPISDDCVESSKIDAIMDVCNNDAASESKDTNCSQSIVLPKENIDEHDQIEVVCLDSDDDELQLPCTSNTPLKDKDIDKCSLSSKDSHTKTLRPVTPVEALEKMLQTFQRKSIANAKQPKHKYQEIKITVAPSVVQFVEQNGGGLTRLGLCFVSLQRIPENKLPACARNNWKPLKRSSRLKNKNQRLVASILKSPTVLQNSNNNEDEEDESSSSTRASSPEIEVLEVIPIQKSKVFPARGPPAGSSPRNGLISRTGQVQRNIAVKRMGSTAPRDRGKMTTTAKPGFTLIKQTPQVRSSIANRSFSNEQKAEISTEEIPKCPQSNSEEASSEDPDFDPSGYISAEDSSKDSYNNDTTDTRQPPIYPQNYPSININPTSPEEVTVADDDESDPLAGVSDYAILEHCREASTFSTVQVETIIDNSASSGEDSDDNKDGETLLSDRDGIQTLPDSFIETVRGSEEGGVEIVDTCEKVSYSDVAADEHEHEHLMREIDMEVEDVDDTQCSPEIPILIPESHEYQRLYNSEDDPPTLEEMN